MITRQQALDICERHFPNGLDRVIQAMLIKVTRSPLCIDGWCYRSSHGNCGVRINSNASRERQNFTLAHEIAHLLLDHEAISINIVRDVYDPKGNEEREADQLASEMLLPCAVMRELVRDSFVDQKLIRKIVRKAKVSDITVAFRLVKLERELNLNSPTVVCFENDDIKYQVPYNRYLESINVKTIFQEAWQIGQLVRHEIDHQREVAAFVLPNPNYPTLFLHYIKPGTTPALSADEERRLELEQILFTNDKPFASSINGKIGGRKTELIEIPVEEAVDLFYHYYERSQGWNCEEHYEKFVSNECREWLLLKLGDLSD